MNDESIVYSNQSTESNHFLNETAFQYYLRVQYSEYKIKYPMISHRILLVKLKDDWKHITNKRTFLLSKMKIETKQKRIKKKIKTRMILKNQISPKLFIPFALYFKDSLKNYQSLGFNKTTIKSLVKESWNNLTQDKQYKYIELADKLICGSKNKRLI